MIAAIENLLKDLNAEIIGTVHEIWFPAKSKKDKANCKVGNVPEKAELFLHIARNMGHKADYKRFTYEGVSIEFQEKK